MTLYYFTCDCVLLDVRFGTGLKSCSGSAFTSHEVPAYPGGQEHISTADAVLSALAKGLATCIENKWSLHTHTTKHTHTQRRHKHLSHWYQTCIFTHVNRAVWLNRFFKLEISELILSDMTLCSGYRRLKKSYLEEMKMAMCEPTVEKLFFFMKAYTSGISKLLRYDILCYQSIHILSFIT